MKYLCLVYFEPKIWDTITKSQAEQIDRESTDYNDELQRRGNHIAAQALQSVDTATTVRIRNGKVSITDGPFAETNEVLGGFVLIHARDLNEALQIATEIPLARMGLASIEVRPVLEPQQLKV
jgi:hypothetical protein